MPIQDNIPPRSANIFRRIQTTAKEATTAIQRTMANQKRRQARSILLLQLLPLVFQDFQPYYLAKHRS